LEEIHLDAKRQDAFMNARKIAVIGMPLAGKTTLVRELMGCDLDDVVETLTKQTIPYLLADGVFRAEETKALMYLVQQGTPLIALGGGANLKQENLALLRDYFVIFLDTPLSVLQQRLKTSPRPLIKEPSDLDRLFSERYPLYVAAAQLQVDGKTLKRLFKEKIV